MTVVAVTVEFEKAIEMVRAEHARATGKYPPFNSSHEGYGVLLEEVDELWDEVKADNPRNAMIEAIQVAAMALRYITEIPIPMEDPDAPRHA